MNAAPPELNEASREQAGAESREPRDVTMQRVRVGVTGLAVVFLLTLLAASLLSFLSPGRHGAGAAASNTVANGEAPKEPLAELGVAPGNAPKTPAKPAEPAQRPPAIAPAAPPPDTVPVPSMDPHAVHPIAPPARR